MFKNNNVYEKIFDNNGIVQTLEKLVLDILYVIYNKEDISNALSKNVFYIDNFVDMFTLDSEILNIKEMLKENEVLYVLYNEFIFNYKDLLWAYNNNRKYLFYIKSRFILEFIGIFYLLLNNENLCNIYKSHNMNPLLIYTNPQ